MEIKQNAQRGTKEEVAITMSDVQLMFLRVICENQTDKIKRDLKSPEFLEVYNAPDMTGWKRTIDDLLQMTEQLTGMITEYRRDMGRE